VSMDIDQDTEFSVLKTQIGVMTYLALRGSLIDQASIDKLFNQIDICAAALEINIVVDLSNVSIINSLGLEAFLDIQELLLRKGGWLKLAQIKPALKEIFYITGLEKSLIIIDKSNDEAYVDHETSSTEPSRRLGEILVEKKLISEEKITEAIQIQSAMGIRLGKVLIDKGWVEEHEVLSGLSQQLNVPYCNVKSSSFDPSVSSLLDKETAHRLLILPLFLIRGELSLATADPQNIAVFEEVTDRLNCRIRPVIVRKEHIVNKINEFYNNDAYSNELISELDSDIELIEGGLDKDYATIDELAGGSPIINLVNTIIQRAVKDKASDVHLEPSRLKSIIRYRIDGVLYKAMEMKVDLHASIVSRLKVMSNLDIAERRMPQDGRIQVKTQGRMIDLRFSSLPGLHGEKVVLRVLDKAQAILDIEKLGMAPSNLVLFKDLLDRQHGLILVTGPTGSGKTTSLYAALNYLNSIEKNIVTIEDPVEYQVDIVNQNPVRENIGLSFAVILKHVLRQDPDIVMVGEIRERDTAEIAVQAALTGHLVLSTLHTNDSIGAITRLIDMGVEPYLLSSALIGVIAQRLIRTVCSRCKSTYIAQPELMEKFGWSEKTKLTRGRGCPECYDSGYKGRIGVHEILETNETLQKLIISNPGRDVLNEYLKENNVRNLFADGLVRVLEGRTTVEELSRVTQ
jgi:type IV pilus assembly protein PilB